MQVEQASRTLIWAGAVLLIVGAALLIGYGAYVLVAELAGDPDVPLAIRIGLPALCAGGVIVLVAVLIEQIRRNRLKDFREVDH